MPRMTFKFGDTYKRNSDRCIDEFTMNRDSYSVKMAQLNQQTAAHPRLTAISYDPAVRDHLNRYRDTHPTQPILMGRSLISESSLDLWFLIHMSIIMIYVMSYDHPMTCQPWKRLSGCLGLAKTFTLDIIRILFNQMFSYLPCL